MAKARTPLIPAEAGTQAEFPPNPGQLGLGPGFRRDERTMKADI
jgi:hypothetical protein